MAGLFDSYKLRDVTFKNRIGVSPMCMYSANDGLPTEWHHAHYGSLALGGAGLIITEATAIEPRGRITPLDCGMWSEDQAEAWKSIVEFMKSQGVVPGIQLAHAGRKASCKPPGEGGKAMSTDEGGWETIAPSPIPFFDTDPVPRSINDEDLDQLLGAWVSAAKRVAAAGFEVLELHMAHGYLCHQFLSPLSNKREDCFGGSFENRTRFLISMAREVREVFPENKPLFVRISCTDWVDGGWDIDQSIQFVKELSEVGVDLVDCSSAGSVPYANVKVKPGYQVPFAEKIRHDTGIPTAAVGLITEPSQAEEILHNNQADIVLFAREMLRNPRWAIQAAKELKVDIALPAQYLRAFT
ncbi:MAG: NADH:flavin oxidoreductase/NADH oxidase [Candidatus Electryonea clarkiae]|nr:NADH:flavin oxidoreductase/NADH oxidase [Candidatus Electryonea clarkiae]MDP8287407.1 NADH:flavin oxidoreductase/NADH oxidase [Candidatus Electryonea clarkiae]